MMIFRTIPSGWLLLPFLLLIGCDDGPANTIVSVDPPHPSLNSDANAAAPVFEGDRLVVLRAGSRHTFEYYCEQEDGGEIEVEVLELPEGAVYSIADDGGNFRRKISITWNPSKESTGLHAISLLGRTKSSGNESHFYVDLAVT